MKEINERKSFAPEKLNTMLDLGEHALKAAESLGASDVEVYLVHGNRLSLNMRNNAVEIATAIDGGQAVVRVYKDHSLGVAVASSLTKGGVKHASQMAVALAGTAPKDEKFVSFATRGELPSLSGQYDQGIESIDPEDLVVPATEMVRAGLDQDERAVVAGNIRVVTNARAIVNNNGISHGYVNTGIIGNTSASISNSPTDVGLGHWDFFSRKHVDLDLTSEARTAVERAQSMLNAKTIDTAALPMIIEELSAMEWIQATVMLGASGSRVADGISYFGDKIGDSVSADLLTVHDRPLVIGGRASAPMDAEGTPHKDLTLIDKGVLQSYVTDSYTAPILNMPNTGHAARGGSLTFRPRPGSSQLHVQGGDMSRDEMLAEMKEGVFLESGIGYRSIQGVNISDKVNRGFYVKNGEIQYALKNTMIASTVPDFLNAIKGASRDVVERFGEAAPRLWIESMQFSSAGETKKPA